MVPQNTPKNATVGISCQLQYHCKMTQVVIWGAREIPRKLVEVSENGCTLHSIHMLTRWDCRPQLSLSLLREQRCAERT